MSGYGTLNSEGVFVTNSGISTGGAMIQKNSQLKLKIIWDDMNETLILKK
ncbi:hypothetical protein KHA80_15740 [Anaerobacillus sp. HL2]|nr:hypothetical protein KHA80_15740 [Anaerobacillus sp. HL2]